MWLAHILRESEAPVLEAGRQQRDGPALLGNSLVERKQQLIVTACQQGSLARPRLLQSS